MRRGTKPLPTGELLASGTFRGHRHAERGQIVVSSDPPITPDYLTAEAQAVWEEELGRVMQGGIGEVDSSLFARYCSTEALAREAFSKGEAVPVAVLTALRQMGELLRIAGPSSRIGVKPGDNAKPSNPFAKLR